MRAVFVARLPAVSGKPNETRELSDNNENILMFWTWFGRYPPYTSQQTPWRSEVAFGSGDK